MHQLAAIRRSRSIVAVGSASTAELAAMKEFAKNPALQVFEARSVKRFGGGQQAPRAIKEMIPRTDRSFAMRRSWGGAVRRAARDMLPHSK